MKKRREKKMGCCGYDELAYKPATTRPLNASNLTTKKLRGSQGVGGLIRPIFPIVNT
jgi:hypothetical protein